MDKHDKYKSDQKKEIQFKDTKELKNQLRASLNEGEQIRKTPFSNRKTTTDRLHHQQKEREIRFSKRIEEKVQQEQQKKEDEKSVVPNRKARRKAKKHFLYTPSKPKQEVKKETLSKTVQPVKKENIPSERKKGELSSLLNAKQSLLIKDIFNHVHLKAPKSEELKHTASLLGTKTKKVHRKFMNMIEETTQEEDDALVVIDGRRRKKTVKEVIKEADQLSEKEGRRLMRKAENRMVKRIVSLLVAVFLLFLFLVSISIWGFWKSGQRPLDKQSTRAKTVEIPLGSSNKQIGAILEKKEIIRSGTVFNYYMKLHNHDGFQAGFYKLSPSMTLDTIASKLKDGQTQKKTIVVPEGYTIEQIARTVGEKTTFSEKQFLDVIKDDAFFKKELKKYPKLLTDTSKHKNQRYRLEGYLFPATYTVTPGGTVKELVEQMIAKTNEILSSYYDEFKQKNLSVGEVITLASLVEKEGVKEQDRRNIASVFFNRLKEGMPFQSDVSLAYIIRESKVMHTIKETKIDSPYNLYMHKGYGPGAFNNPSESAIKAVLYPEPNNYLYFVADVDTGKVYFSSTIEEHNGLVAKYVNEREAKKN